MYLTLIVNNRNKCCLAEVPTLEAIEEFRSVAEFVAYRIITTTYLPRLAEELFQEYLDEKGN